MARRPEDENEDEEMEAEGDGGESEEEESSEDDEQEKPLTEPRKDAVYDVSGLQEKLEDIAWPADTDWIHSLSVSRPLEGNVNVEDDLAREMAFYTLALDGAKDAYGKLQSLGIPFLRPTDYYAEMVKSDKHMLKVKTVLVNQQKQLEEQQERRKAREAKKFAKEVQAEKVKERNKQKKEEFESVKKWRKMRQKSDFSRGEDEFPADLGDGKAHQGKKKSAGSVGAKRKRGTPSVAPAPWDRSGGKAKAGNRPGNKPGGNRQNNRSRRDGKFGFGGKKGMKKTNTAESFADVPGGSKGHKNKMPRRHK